MTMASSNFRSGEVTRQQKLTQQNSESGIRKFNASTANGETSISHQPKLPENFMPERREVQGSTYSAMGHIPVTKDMHFVESEE